MIRPKTCTLKLYYKQQPFNLKFKLSSFEIDNIITFSKCQPLFVGNTVYVYKTSWRMLNVPIFFAYYEMQCRILGSRVVIGSEGIPHHVTRHLQSNYIFIDIIRSFLFMFRRFWGDLVLTPH